MSAGPALPRVRIEYYDRNERFARFLPRSGRLSRMLPGCDGGSPWFLVELDRPFVCDAVAGAAGRCERLVVSRFVIRSRWPDNEIGERDPASVLVLIVDDTRGLRFGAVDPRDYHLAAWGMCHTEAGGQPADPGWPTVAGTPRVNTFR